MTFDEEFFIELEKKLTETQNEHIGIKCARAQFNLLQNVRAQIEEVETLRAENITLKVVILRLKKQLEERLSSENQHKEGDPPPV